MVDDLSLEALELTEKMVEKETTKDDQEELENCIDFVEQYFDDEKLELRRYSEDGKPSLVVLLEDTYEPEVMLHGHIDVVEAEDDEMFNPEREGGWLYGRGTADMKGGVASLMIAMKRLAESENPASVGLMIVSDEEIGGFKGAKYLLEDEEYRPQFAVSAEPCQRQDKTEITLEQKGVFKVDVEAEGRPAHASKPWEGENAVRKLMASYREIEENLPDIRGDSWSTTVTLSKIEGGEATNTVAGKAGMHLDIRYTSMEDVDTVKSILESVEGVSYDVFDLAPKLATSRQNSYARKLRSAAETETGESEFNRKPEASDMRYFSERDIPAVVFGPVGQNIHGRDERLLVESLGSYIRTIEGFIEEL